MLRRATLVVLNRRYVLQDSKGAPAEGRGDLQTLALVRAKAAAAQTNAILEKIIHQDMVKLMKPMTYVSRFSLPGTLELTCRRITAVIPAMQIHLLDCKSPVSLIRRLGNHRLQLCMIVLSELQDTYWGANFAARMFRLAQSKLRTASLEVSQPSLPENGNGTTITQPEEAAMSQSQRAQTQQSQPLPNLLSTTNIDDMLNFDFVLPDMTYSFWNGDVPNKYVKYLD